MRNTFNNNKKKNLIKEFGRDFEVLINVGKYTIIL